MDEIIRAVTADGFAKISVISAKNIVETARQHHNTSPVATAALGRTLCAASMLGDFLKAEDASVTVRINGGGAIGNVVAVSDSEGNVRGYVQNPTVDIPNRPDGKLDVGGAVGNKGTITVSRDLGLKEPYIGTSELISGEIAEDLARYFVESEQVPSACGLGVLVDTDLSVKCAGGFIVQLLPGAPDSLIDAIEGNIYLMGSVTEILSNWDAEQLVNEVLMHQKPEILSRTAVDYRCYCSHDRVSRAIQSMGRDNLQEIVSSGEETEVTCQFCPNIYRFSADEVSVFLEENAQ